MTKIQAKIDAVNAMLKLTCPFFERIDVTINDIWLTIKMRYTTGYISSNIYFARKIFETTPVTKVADLLRTIEVNDKALIST